MSAGRVWVLDFPRPDEWISANQREHHMVKAAKTRRWREATADHARRAGIPLLEAATVLVEPRWTDHRRRDALNVAPTAKAAIDGLTDAGCWVDDDDKHLLGVTFRQGPKAVGLARLRLTITECAPEGPVEGQTSSRTAEAPAPAVAATRARQRAPQPTTERNTP